MGWVQLELYKKGFVVGFAEPSVWELGISAFSLYLHPFFPDSSQLPKALLIIPGFVNPRELQALILEGMGAVGRCCLLLGG